MRILLCHNFYQKSGGEDEVFKNESELLKINGNEVLIYKTYNKDFDKLNKYQAFIKTIFNFQTYHDISNICKEKKPDVVHFHNTFPLMSPSVYYAASKCNVPVVQTIHNYRLLCLNAYLFRNGSVCEKCVNLKFKWPGIFYKCYRNSRTASFVVAFMLLIHKVLGTWKRIDCFIALSDFQKRKLIQASVAKEKIVTKSNHTYEFPKQKENSERYILYAGRLSTEKGIEILLEAFNLLENVILNIAGSGIPKADLIRYIDIGKRKNVNFLGQIENEKIQKLINRSFIIIYPSLLFETFGLTIIEAFSNGIPVIASNHGSMAELVHNGKTGILFEPGNSLDLANKIKWAYENPERIYEMGKNAHEDYLKKYTEEISYQNLLNIYNSVSKKNGIEK